MQWMWASVECKEGGAIASNKIACPFYVHYQGNEVVNVVIRRALWIDVNFNSQLKAIHEWDQIIQELWRGDKMLIFSKQCH